jgi:hypothetical protein
MPASEHLSAQDGAVAHRLRGLVARRVGVSAPVSYRVGSAHTLELRPDGTYLHDSRTRRTFRLVPGTSQEPLDVPLEGRGRVIDAILGGLTAESKASLLAATTPGRDVPREPAAHDNHSEPRRAPDEHRPAEKPSSDGNPAATEQTPAAAKANRAQAAPQSTWRALTASDEFSAARTQTDSGRSATATRHEQAPEPWLRDGFNTLIALANRLAEVPGVDPSRSFARLGLPVPHK